MKTIEIYEPPMCCPTGVCGPAPDPELAAWQEVILKLKKDGHSVERIAINQQPARFMSNPLVKKIVNAEGKDSLPITIIGDKVIIKGRYPKYEELVKEVK
jgi:hypothetical protein